MMPNADFGPGGKYEMVGAITVEAPTGTDPMSPELRDRVRLEACRLGGVALSLLGNGTEEFGQRRSLVTTTAQTLAFTVWGPRSSAPAQPVNLERLLSWVSAFQYMPRPSPSSPSGPPATVSARQSHFRARGRGPARPPRARRARATRSSRLSSARRTSRSACAATRSSSRATPRASRWPSGSSRRRRRCSRQGVDVGTRRRGARAAHAPAASRRCSCATCSTPRSQLGAGRRPVGPRGLAQKRYVEAIRTHDLTFGIGPAGTGKTYLAMACAVAALHVAPGQAHRPRRAPRSRQARSSASCPGDLAEKVNPYLRPLYDALDDMMDIDKAQGLIARGHIEVAPLAFMRGRTLNDSFVILDEAQNTTSEQMRMFLTRLGYHSKAVVTGDVTQVDLPEGRASGLRRGARAARRRRGHRVLPLHRGRRRAPPARAEDHRPLRGARRAGARAREAGVSVARRSAAGDDGPRPGAARSATRASRPTRSRGPTRCSSRSWRTLVVAQRARARAALRRLRAGRAVGPRARAARAVRGSLRRGPGAARAGRAARATARSATRRAAGSRASSTPTRRADDLYLAAHRAFELLEAKARAEARGRWLRRYRYELGELIHIARAMTTVRDVDKLLGVILEKSRFVTGADAGSIYIVEPHPARERATSASSASS